MDQLPTELTVDFERQFDLQPGALVIALACMVGALPAGLCIHDSSRRVLYVNRQMADLFGRSPEEMMGRCIDDWLDPSKLDELHAADEAAAILTTAQTRFHSLDVAGRSRIFQVTRYSMQRGPDPSLTLCCSIWRDPGTGLPGAVEAELPEALVAETESSVIDQLAPIGRTLFDDQLRRELDLSKREQREFALVAIASDAGHPEGGVRDESTGRWVAQRVERLLRGNIRAMDSSFRVASNLFFMILSGVGLATAHSRVEALRRQFASEGSAGGNEGDRSGISIGVASFPHTARDRAEIVQAAETALAVARQRGGNQVALARIPFQES